MKKIKTLRGFAIYQAGPKELAQAEKEGVMLSEYNVFLPDESPDTLCSPEFECDSLQEAVENINSYDAE